MSTTMWTTTKSGTTTATTVLIYMALTAFTPTAALSWLLDSAFLARRGLEFNQHDFDLTKSVSAGAHIAIGECGYQFKYDQWNCPEQAFHLSKATSPTSTISNSNSEANRLAQNTYQGFKLAAANSNSRSKKSVGLPATRESAYIHAITSAGITHTLTKNCSTGDFGDCGCDSRLTKRRYGWKWGGCSDNFHFGSQVAREFLDTIETGKDRESLANLHNNEAGRVAVRKKMRRVCKCHGVSGSCTTHTCWSTLSDFRVVGSFLKKMYRQALRVDYDFEKGQLDRADNLIRAKLTEAKDKEVSNTLVPKGPSQSRPSRSSRRGRRRRNNRRRSKSRKQVRLNGVKRSRSNRMPSTTTKVTLPVKSGRLIRYKRKSEKIKKRKLVFLEESPDYCDGNAEGVESVLNRKCITEPENPKSRATVQTCSRLCRKCGYKVVKTEVEVLTPCNCRFKWCCNVTCETCKVKRIEITCARPDSYSSNSGSGNNSNNNSSRRKKAAALSPRHSDRHAFSKAVLSALWQHEATLQERKIIR